MDAFHSSQNGLNMNLVAAGGETAAKNQGKMQLKGRDYIIEDGDICHFRFNV